MTLELSPTRTTTTSQQPLDLVLAEAKKNQSKSGYENQIKAAFYYQVALTLCQTASNALSHAAKLSEEKRSASDKKVHSPAEITAQKNHYADQQKKILSALIQIESEYPIQAFLIEDSSQSNLSLTPVDHRESKSILSKWLTPEVIQKRLAENPYKQKLQAIRTKATLFLAQYRKQKKSHERVQIKFDKGDGKTLESKSLAADSKLTMQSIHALLTQEIRVLFEQMITDGITDYSQIAGQPPCDYAVISLGSMAREEMTPYSDLEFGILIAEDDTAGKNKTYFRHLTQLLHLRVINLGETTPTIMNVKLPEGIPSPIPNGLSFDGAGPGGSKNPLGKKDKKTGASIFELIGTPEALARYQEEACYKTGPLSEERFLPSSLAQVGLITGSKKGEQLIADYQQLVAQKLVVKHSDKPLHQSRALNLMAMDIPRFRAKYGRQETSHRSYSVKHDLYRLPNMLLSELAMYYGLFDANNLWTQLQQLTDTVKLFNPTAAQHLLTAIDQIAEYRLAAYLVLEEQVENAVLSENPQLVLTGSCHAANKVFYLPKTAVFEAYYSLVPLWYASKWFRDGKGYKAAFAQPVLKDFYANTAWVEATFKLMLQGPAQALSSLEPTLKTLTSLEEKTALPRITFDNALTLQLAGQAYVETGTALAEAQRYFALALPIFSELNPALSDERLRCELGLAWVNWMQGKSTASHHHEMARDLIRTHFSEAHPYWAECAQVGYYLQSSPGSLPGLKLPEHMGNWHLPPDNKKHFVGRTTALDQLRKHFQPVKGGMQLCFLSALSGLGGIGKTQIALHYAHHAEYSYGMRLWFRAEQESTLFADYIELAERFRLLAPGEKLEKNKLIARVKNHLETHPDWLAVYDNVSSYSSVKHFLPTRGGHVLITTRRSKESLSKELIEHLPGFTAVASQETKRAVLTSQDDVAPKVSLLEVEKFSSEEALNYLKNYLALTTLDPSTETALQNLAVKLDYLPLALAQAAAYITRCRITPEDYLTRYKTSHASLLAKKLLPADSHSEPVATTWEVSITAILQEEEKEEKETGKPGLAVSLLQAMSYLYPDQIPETLLGRWLKTTHRLTSAAVKAWPEYLRTHLDRLAAYSLIHHDSSAGSSDRTVSIHRLVQEVIRNREQPTLLHLPALGDKKGEEKSESKLPVLLGEKIQPVKIVLPAKDKTALESKKETKEEATAKIQQAVELEKAVLRHRHSKRQYRQGNLTTAEKPLREAIAIYQQYGDSYSGELCDSLLDLSLLLQAQANQESKGDKSHALQEAAQKSFMEAQSCLKKTTGFADARRSRCATIEWYLQQSPGSVFAVKASLTASSSASSSLSLSPLSSTADTLGKDKEEKKALIKADEKGITVPIAFDYWGLPDNNDTYFVGRESLLKSLNQHSKPDQAYKMMVLSAVSGLGGVGKTQLAIYYLYHAEHRYNLKIWFRAENAILLLADYKTFAQEFDLISTDGKTSSKEIIEAVKRYLEQHPDWLVVYDNAGSRDEIREFLPTKGGHILITTRRQEWHDVGIKIKVNIFTATEAIAYLKKLTGVEGQEAAMAELAQMVGYLPLAIGQAGAYIKKQRITIAAYIEDYKKRAAELLQEQLTPEEDYRDTVATTWHISLKALQADEAQAGESPLSLIVLEALAYLHAEDVPRDMLEKWLQDQKLVKDPIAAQLALDNVIRHLQDYSLVHVDAGRSMISIHRLVQAVIRQGGVIIKKPVLFAISDEKVIPAEVRVPGVLETLADTVRDEFDQETQVVEDEKRRKELLSHLQALAHHLEQLRITPPPLTLGSLLFKIGEVLLEQIANAQEAKACFERALMIVEAHSGRDHWQTLPALTSLAIAHGVLGDVSTQKALLERALLVQESPYDSYHLQEATILASLANAYGDLGDASTKKTLLERVLLIDEAFYGQDHWQVAIILVNLAAAHGALGDASTQKILLERALLIEGSHYGRDHWRPAITLVNLATAYGDLGDVSTRKVLLERALPIQELHYGKGHWQTVAALVGLATVHGDLGDASTKKTLLERVLLIQEAYYGRDHWEVAINLNNLANAYGDLGDSCTKKALLERALVIQKAHYSPDHWQVAITLANLATAYGELGDASTEKSLLEKVLVIEEAHYGRAHWQVAVTLVNLATAHGTLGDAITQKKLLEEALQIQEAYFGRSHWRVAATLRSLATAYEDLEDSAIQTALLERTLSIQEAHYGRSHWQVAITLGSLAIVYGNLGDTSTKKTLLERALVIQEAHYGRDHQAVGIMLFNLAQTNFQLENWEASFNQAERAHQIFQKSYTNAEHPYTQEAEAILERLRKAIPVLAVYQPEVLTLLQRSDSSHAHS